MRAEDTQRQKQDNETLDNLPRVDASYRAGAVYELKSGLTDGTQANKLKEIEEWANRPSSGRNQAIYLMKGAFGTGKSTIAHEISKRLNSEGQLAASFFFLRDSPGFNSPNLVFSTIARQLALSQPLLRQHIVGATRSHMKYGVDKQSMESQVRDLIIEPLKLAPKDHLPIVIIIDGLDECSENNPTSRTRMLDLLINAVYEIPITLRILITTRPIRDIEEAFRSSHKRELILHDVARAEVDGDIKLYLRKAVVGSWGEALLESHPDAIAILTTMAEGLFIFARTAVRFLAEYPSIVVKEV